MSASALVFRFGEVLSGTYAIRRLIGEGGAGQVFEAHDIRLNRLVAIKALRSSAGPAESEKLLREGRALALLRHPGLVAVHAFGSHRGIAYIVMERLYGLTLFDHIDSRRRFGQLFSISEVLDILTGIGEALRAVHRSGGAHCDLKPANVILTADGRCVLTDFGIHTLEASPRRVEGTVSGTPLYMAPEMIADRVAPGSYHLVDLYGLGVNGYEILTGLRPFDDEDVSMLLMKHLRAPVPDPAVVRPDTPPALGQLIMALLSKDPASRPPTIDQVLWRLRELAERRSSSGSRFSVLIVDDDVPFVAALEQELGEVIEGVEIRAASDGAAALGMVRERPPDLMLLDLHMPGMSGLEVCMHLRGTRRAERCTIVCISGRAGLQDIEVFTRFGVTEFVPKGRGLIARLRPVLQRLCAGRLAPALPPGATEAMGSVRS